jgi:hypothetical protein
MKIFIRAIAGTGLGLALFLTASNCMAINCKHPSVLNKPICALIGPVNSVLAGVNDILVDMKKVVEVAMTVINAPVDTGKAVALLVIQSKLFSKANTQSNVASIASATKNNATLINSNSSLENQLAVFNTPTTVTGKNAKGKTTTYSTLSSNTMTKPLTYSPGEKTAVKHYQTIANGTAYAPPAPPANSQATPTAVSYAVYHKTTSQIRSNTINNNANIASAHTANAKGKPSAHEQGKWATADLGTPNSDITKTLMDKETSTIMVFIMATLNKMRAIPTFANNMLKKLESVAGHVGSLASYTGLAIHTMLGEALHMSFMHSGDQRFGLLKKKAGA